MTAEDLQECVKAVRARDIADALSDEFVIIVCELETPNDAVVY
jgi:hypothetical protein